MSDSTRAARIWYQSFVDPAAQAPYVDRLRSRLAAVAAPGFTFDVHGIVPPDRYFHAITEFRCADQAIQAAITAEKQGYDAFVIGHLQEPGLIECRGVVDIPVVSLGEATLLYACTLGRRIGLVTISPVFIPWHADQIRSHGLEHRVTGTTAIRADLARFMLAFEDAAEYAALRDDFATAARPLIAQGADVIVPAGGLPALLFAREQPFAIDGALVVEGIAALAKAAEMAVAMHRLTGAAVSRGGIYARAPDGAVTDYLATRGTGQEGSAGAPPHRTAPRFDPAGA